MNNFISRIFLFAVVPVLALGATNAFSAEDFGEYDYEVYIGDLNGDGINDLYLTAGQYIMPIHGQVVTPVTIPNAQNYAFYGVFDQITGSISYLSGAVEVGVINTSSLLSAGLVAKEDWNRDGYVDLIIDQSFGGKESLAILGGAAGDALQTVLVDVPEYTSEAPISFASIENILDQSLIDQSDALGEVAGSFRVNESGAATYSVPILIPQGTAGVAPELSLSYSSQGGNGLVGQGWALSGLSAISRCRQTLITDGQALPITWSADDRFCLNGQRLIEQFGYTGKRVFKTEIDTFVTVSAFGGALDSDPSYFLVEAKDGTKSFYGNTEDSSFDNLSDITLTWSINRTEDSVGNAINYIYETDDVSQKISAIEFGTNSYSHSSVHFQYEPRGNDIITRYIAGFKTETTDRLQAITSVTEGSEVRYYELTYDDINTDLSRLIKVDECASSSKVLCKQGTEFAWQYPLPLLSRDSQDLVDVSNKLIEFSPGDLNGDGLTDVFYLRQRPEGSNDVFIGVLVSDGETLHEQGREYVYHENLGEEEVRLAVIDYNADGRSDAAVYNERDKQWAVYISEYTDGGWSLPEDRSKAVVLPFDEVGMLFGDLNSDGLVDAYYLDDDAGIFYVYAMVSSGEESTSNQFYKFKDSPDVSDYSRIDYSDYKYIDEVGSICLASLRREYKALKNGVADFDADGRIDLLVEEHLSCAKKVPGDRNYSWDTFEKNLVYLSYNASTSKLENPTYVLWGRDFNFIDDPIVTDVNNDGLSDLVVPIGNETSVDNDLFINTGQGFAHVETIFTGEDDDQIGDSAVQFVDIDMDGYDDAVWHDYKHFKLVVRYWDSSRSKFSDQFDLPVANQSEISDEWLNYIYSEFGAEARDALLEASVTFLTNGDRDDRYLWMSLQGNGVPDLVRYTSDDGGKLQLYGNLQVNNSHHVIDKITHGLGSVTSIDYQIMGRSEHYRRADVAISSEEVEVCYTVYDVELCFPDVTYNTDEFYRQLNDPFADLENSLAVANAAPVLELNGGFYLVTSVSSSAPHAEDLNAESSVQYYYAQARAEAGGRGYLGFKYLSTVDAQTGVTSTTEYRQDFPFNGRPYKTETTYKGQVVSSSQNLWDVNFWTTDAQDASAPVYQPFLKTAVDKTFGYSSNSTNGFVGSTEVFSTTSTDTTYDKYGNVEQLVSHTDHGGEQASTTTFNTYDSTEDGLRFGRLIKSEVIHSIDNQPDISRIAEFKYYGFGCADSGSLTGLLCEETTLVDTEYQLTTSYQYDNFGNIISTTVAGDGKGSASSRTSSQVFDSNGRYLLSTANHFGQVTSEIISRDPLGNPLEQKDILGNRIHTAYSTFGRAYLEHGADGAYTYSYNAVAGDACPATAVYQTHSFNGDGGESLVCYDLHGREVLTGAPLLGGEWVYKESEYDINGRLIRQSSPFAAGDTRQWAINQYDDFANLVRIDVPGQAGSRRVTERQFNNNVLTTINPLQHQRTDYSNSQGELKRVEEAGTTIDYVYDATGNLINVSTNGQHDVQIVFNDSGFKTGMIDPDKGIWVYDHNAFGELVSQTNGNGDTVTMEYDAAGRMIKRTEAEGVTEWAYNNTTSGNSQGQLEYEFLLADGVIPHQVRYTYDSLGRASATATLIDGEEHSQWQTYDALGRALVSSDASEYDSAVRYDYSNGYLHRVTNAEDSSIIYYQANQMDVHGNVVEYLQGALTTTKYFDPATGFLQSIYTGVGVLFDIQQLEYRWDAVGNLLERHDQSGNKNLQETFGYDELNRLDWSQLQGTGVYDNSLQNYEYDAFGNIKEKAGVGTYRYGDDCSIAAGAHAVCELVTDSGTETFQYDNNGNMTEHHVGGVLEREFVYASFDKPTTIALRGNQHITEFEYGTSRARYRRTDTNASGEVTTTLYLGNVEKVTKPNGEREIRRFVNGDILVTQTFNSQNGVESYDTRYVLKDHLGSVDVIVDWGGTIVQEQSFDAWGNRRSVIDAESLNLDDLALQSKANNQFTTRGFTGHEMVDELGIIHMNGRIYDPRLARFLQADPLIDGAATSQGYNRYSYGKNNPLNGTDPSGFSFYKEFFDDFLGTTENQWVNLIVTIVANALTYGLYSVVQGAAAAYETGGWGAAFESIVISAIMYGAFSAIGNAFENCNSCSGSFANTDYNGWAYAGKAVAHGLAGGIGASLQGGKFGHGFASAGVTQAFSPAIDGLSGPSSTRIALAAIVGGTASKVSGGKFANGAVTAAFSRAWNDEKDHSTDGDAQEAPKITFSVSEEKLVATLTVDGETQVIEMSAVSGGWDGAAALSEGEWRIVEYAGANEGYRGRYFSLFKIDGNVNNQFLQDGVWRDGVLLGFHGTQGSHGCIMTCPTNMLDYEAAAARWDILSSWIRSGPSSTLSYRNNSNPRRSDPTLYNIQAYGTLTVTK